MNGKQFLLLFFTAILFDIIGLSIIVSNSNEVIIVIGILVSVIGVIILFGILCILFEKFYDWLGNK